MQVRIKEVLAGIASLVNKQRETQAWGIVVFENGKFKGEIKYDN